MEGWHVPTDAEWNIMKDYLGDGAGGKLKEQGTDHWNAPNTGATNESGFTAFSTGYRDYNNGSYQELGTATYFWTSSNISVNEATYKQLSYESSDVNNNYRWMRSGFSVRCIED